MNAREASFKILFKFEESNNRLEDLINEIFARNNISPKEKKSIYNLSSGVVRNLSLMDWKISQLFKGNYKKSLNKFKVIMRLAIFEIDFLDFIPSFATVNEYVNLAKRKLDKRNSAVVNGILRTYLREKGKYNPEKKFKFRETQLSVKYSFPEWMILKWIDWFGETETELLCKSFNERPEFDVRVNTTKIQIEEFQKVLEDNQVNYIPSEYFPSMLKITDVQKISQLKLFEEGFCSIQDESANLITELMDIQKGDYVLDACVAPGGKFTALLAKKIEAVTLVGSDINKDRISVVQQNCKRLGFDKYFLMQSDSIYPAFKQKFDKILIDAPCSGLGTIQKNPDIKWRRNQNEIENFQKLQINILNSVSKILKQDGYLIYSTCTINREENEDVIEKFLMSNKSFSLIPPKKSFKKFIKDENFLQTFPHIHKMDGSFAAILKFNQ
jgi:16S rRNA (cytosine967-C5)-methyltransferase